MGGRMNAPQFGKCFIEVDGKLTDIRELNREQYTAFVKMMEDVFRTFFILDYRDQHPDPRPLVGNDTQSE